MRSFPSRSLAYSIVPPARWPWLRLPFAAVFGFVFALPGCGADARMDENGTGGASIGDAGTGGLPQTGGALQTGGASTAGGVPSTGGVPPAGGVPSAGGADPTGGAPPTGGTGPTGGVSTGGVSTGGVSTGGVSTGGVSTGGVSTGGVSTGGVSTGGTSTGGTGGGWSYPAGVTKPRIMIVGDSISAGPGCYKKYLLQNLNDNGYSSFEFVGEYNDDCGGVVKHSAVSCSTTTQYTQASFMVSNCFPDKTFPGLATLVSSHDPDLIMIQLGVNDVWGGQTVDAILGEYTTLVQQARAHNAAVALVVAQIHKINPDCSSDDSKTKLAESLVNAVPAWAQGLSTAESPVFVADLWTNSDWSQAETTDCVHPNDTGAQKMGLNWYNALKGVLKPG